MSHANHIGMQIIPLAWYDSYLLKFSSRVLDIRSSILDLWFKHSKSSSNRPCHVTFYGSYWFPGTQNCRTFCYCNFQNWFFWLVEPPIKDLFYDWNRTFQISTLARRVPMAEKLIRNGILWSDCQSLADEFQGSYWRGTFDKTWSVSTVETTRPGVPLVARFLEYFGDFFSNHGSQWAKTSTIVTICTTNRKSNTLKLLLLLGPAALSATLFRNCP